MGVVSSMSLSIFSKLNLYLLLPLSPPSQDPDYAFELNEDNPEFKKLAFVSPGVKNSFAPLKRSTRTCFGKKEKGSIIILW